jgi:hypothetical protein
MMLVCFALAALVGCGGSRQGRVATESGGDGKVPADAYLFDSKIYRDGKPTTVRLEVFVTDSVIGFGGRAYLGKGALKGRLTPDSLELYFPSTHEYLYEPVEMALGSSDCPFPLEALNVISLFHVRPDSLDWNTELRMAPNYQDDKRPRFIVFRDECDWQIELAYDRKDDVWRVREFEFVDGKGFVVKGSRREVKTDSRVKSSKFRLDVPNDIVRITP